MADKVDRQIWVLTKLSVDKRQSSCRNYSHIGAQCIWADKVEVRTLEVFHHVEHVAICCTLGLGVSFTPVLRAGAIDANKQFYVGTTAVAFDSLKALLQPIILKEKTAIPTIVINADKTVEIDLVVSVMRVAKEMGAKTVLSTEKQ